MQKQQFETVYDINGMQLACQRIANQSVKVIALHGWQDNSNSFLPIMLELSHFDWYALDFPGHGKSDWRNQQAHYYFIDYVDDVYRLKQLIAPNEQVILLGHSMGAMVANLFAACFPEHIRAVVAVEGIASVTTNETEVTTQLKRAILNRIEEKGMRVFSDFEQVVKARMAVSDFSYDIAALLMQRNVSPCENGYKLHLDPKLKHHSGFRFSETQCVEMCKRVTTPMLVIHANKGYKLVSQGIEKYGKYYSNLTSVEVLGGHHCHLEHSAQIANIIDVYVNETV